jgi:hypothetical protein
VVANHASGLSVQNSGNLMATLATTFWFAIVDEEEKGLDDTV